ncbi:MAG: MFS transporter [Phycisphaerales bacterium]
MTPDAPSSVGFRLSLMMFLQFFVWGSWYVSMATFMRANGMDPAIATAYSVAPVAAILSPFALGMVADRFFASERMLGALHIAGGAVIALAPVAAGFEWSGAPKSGILEFLREWPFILVLLVHVLCYMPTLGLANAIAFNAMTAPQRQFPLVRVWGTIGWIAAGWTISALGADKAPKQFLVAAAAAVLLGLYSFTLPHTPPPARGRPFSARDALGLDALALLRRPSFAIFIVASCLMCIPLAAYYAFAAGFVGDVGPVGDRIAATTATMSIGQIAEICFMLAMPLFFARLGVKWMLAAGMLAWALRYTLFASATGATWDWFHLFTIGGFSVMMPRDPVGWMILLGIALHGICYDFFFVTGQIYTEQIAPARIRASAQGLLVLVTQGLGMLIGAQIMGRVFAASTRSVVDAATGTKSSVTDWAAFWWVPAIMALAVLVLFVLTFHDRPSIRGADDPHEGSPARA